MTPDEVFEILRPLMGFLLMTMKVQVGKLQVYEAGPFSNFKIMLFFGAEKENISSAIENDLFVNMMLTRTLLNVNELKMIVVMNRMRPSIGFKIRNKHRMKLTVTLHSGNIHKISGILQGKPCARSPALYINI